MVPRLTLGPHLASALMEQFARFDGMPVHLAKSADLAMKQANEILTWSSNLVVALDQLNRNTEKAAMASQLRVEERVHELETQASITHRKILETNDLGPSRTLKANFRLIFGPPRESRYKSNSTKSVATSNNERIDVIRDLCENYAHGVIALSTAYPTKAWTQASQEVFNGIVQMMKDMQEQNWPVDIVNIIDELEAERPMSIKIRFLRGIIDVSCFFFILD
ncbi:hypothetical protein MMC09_003014 [Bachmanniomyces sp. S44760]|nr:hypothetical protein [Bachmanniomyces sp. S44760]